MIGDPITVKPVTRGHLVNHQNGFLHHFVHTHLNIALKKGRIYSYLTNNIMLNTNATNKKIQPRHR
jgi:hypothetical protein